MIRTTFRTCFLQQARCWSDVSKASQKSSTTVPSANISVVPPAEKLVQSKLPDAEANFMASSQSNLFIKVDELEPVPETEALRKSASFDDVPGPQVLRHVSRLWGYIPVMGTQVTASAIQYLLSAGKLFGSQLSWGNNLWLFRWLLDEYGPVVRLHGPFGGDVVILSRPEHVGAVFQNEGRYPVRSSLDCIEKYRLQYRRYKHAGPFLMYGPEWEKLRKNIEESLQGSTTRHLDKVYQTCDDFIARIVWLRNRQEEVPPNFKLEIDKWSLECMMHFMLNTRLGFLEKCGISSTSEPGRVLEGLNGATDAIRRCEFGLHLWKFMDTPAWKSLVKHCDSIDSVLNKYIHKAQNSLREKKKAGIAVDRERVSLLESLLVRDGMTSEDVLTVLLDMMVVGVNAVSHSVAFLMYHLARSPRVQHRLYQEIQNVPQSTDFGSLRKLPYLQACIKESLRLKPPMPILSRVLSKEVIVHNYRIPKGTYVLIATHLSSLREEHFEDAQKFLPERWLSADFHKGMDSFATIPFGHGPRACLAREMAEMQIGLLITKIVSIAQHALFLFRLAANQFTKNIGEPRQKVQHKYFWDQNVDKNKLKNVFIQNSPQWPPGKNPILEGHKILRKFRIEYHYGDIKTTNKLLASPDRPLKFRFVDLV